MKTKKIAAVLLTCIVAIGLMAGCGASNTNQSASNNDSQSTSTNQSGNEEADTNSENTTDTTENTSTGNGKTLVVYYSASGNTKDVAEKIAKSRGNKTEWNKTEGSEPDPFSSDAEDESDERTRLEAYFMQSLEVDLLLRACPDEEDTIHQIVNLLVDTCSSKRRMLRVAGDDKPAEVVRSRFMKLNVLERHCNQAKIPVISVHGLRHTHASVLLFAGVSIASVARRLGHSSMTTTQKTYLHIIRELENQDIDLVMRSLSGLS